MASVFSTDGREDKFGGQIDSGGPVNQAEIFAFITKNPFCALATVEDISLVSVRS